MTEASKYRQVFFIKRYLLIFNRRYSNEPIYSDDDMEANAGDVLREEKRR